MTNMGEGGAGVNLLSLGLAQALADKVTEAEHLFTSDTCN
jgi:hypothetical protein